MARDRLLGQLDQSRIDIGVRAGAIGLAVAFTGLTGSTPDLLPQLTMLSLLAMAALLPVTSRRLRYWRPVAEALLAGLIIATAEPYDPVLLPYVVAPALTAGLTSGWRLATIASSTALLGLLAPRADELEPGGEFLVDAVQWALLALVVGLLAAWVRRVQTEVPGVDASYQEAARLLTQLREVSRELSGGLDAVSIGGTLLDEVRESFEVTRGWIFGYRSGGVPQPLAYGPGIDPGLPVSLENGTIWRQVLETHEPVVTLGPLASDPSMSGVLLPIRIRETIVGLVALERRGQAWLPDELVLLQGVIDRDAPRIDAALLFDDVRYLATAEERQRLAREIHDGVAQEVASLGYLVDDLLARAPEALQDDLRGLRDELSRVVGELRYSIFDLRREIGAGATLTSVLAEHARHVGETSGIAVHLDLSESPTRLRPAIESELLRIAQEAIGNARKHSRAHNLWVQCHVDAPHVRLQVDDDGRGLLPPREDSFGLAIMRERAARAGCEISISDRPGGGTSVEVHTVGRRDSGTTGRERDDSRAAGR